MLGEQVSGKKEKENNQILSWKALSSYVFMSNTRNEKGFIMIKRQDKEGYFTALTMHVHKRDGEP